MDDQTLIHVYKNINDEISDCKTHSDYRKGLCQGRRIVMQMIVDETIRKIKLTGSKETLDNLRKLKVILDLNLTEQYTRQPRAERRV